MQPVRDLRFLIQCQSYNTTDIRCWKNGIIFYWLSIQLPRNPETKSLWLQSDIVSFVVFSAAAKSSQNMLLKMKGHSISCLLIRLFRFHNDLSFLCPHHCRISSIQLLNFSPFDKLDSHLRTKIARINKSFVSFKRFCKYLSCVWKQRKTLNWIYKKEYFHW